MIIQKEGKNEEGKKNAIIAEMLCSLVAKSFRILAYLAVELAAVCLHVVFKLNSRRDRAREFLILLSSTDLECFLRGMT